MSTASADLAALRAALLALLETGKVRQEQIAEAAGVDQGFVSRLKNGSAKRFTGRAQRVMNYVNMQVKGTPMPDAVTNAVRAYLRAGGDPALLCDQLVLLGRARRR